MKKSSIVLIVAALFLLIPLIAQSEEIHRRGACKADFEKFCKDVKSGQGRIVRCMQAHENELSPACRDQIAADKEKHKNLEKLANRMPINFVKALNRDMAVSSVV